MERKNSKSKDFPSVKNTTKKGAKKSAKKSTKEEDGISLVREGNQDRFFVEVVENGKLNRSEIETETIMKALLMVLEDSIEWIIEEYENGNTVSLMPKIDEG